jgi:hypothetical protein
MNELDVNSDETFYYTKTRRLATAHWPLHATNASIDRYQNIFFGQINP